MELHVYPKNILDAKKEKNLDVESDSFSMHITPPMSMQERRSKVAFLSHFRFKTHFYCAKYCPPIGIQ